MNNAQSETYDKIVQELRRGSLVIAVLAQLPDAKYGYELLTELNEHGIEIDQGTLYPLLRRLESQGLLDSEWNTEGSRPRRYYVINQSGKVVLQALIEDWNKLMAVMKPLLRYVEA